MLPNIHEWKNLQFYGKFKSPSINKEVSLIIKYIVNYRTYIHTLYHKFITMILDIAGLDSDSIKLCTESYLLTTIRKPEVTLNYCKTVKK